MLADVAQRDGHPERRLCNTLEFSRIWYLYVCQHLPPDEHIVIVDQCSAFDIAYWTSFLEEPFEVLGEGWDYNPAMRVHVKRFNTKTDKLGGVKRFYLWAYEFAYRNGVDMFTIENDCLVARDVVTETKDADFATSYLYTKERVCDTFLCKISARRLHDMDGVVALPDYLAHLRALDTYRGDRWTEDIVCMALCERGAYAQFAHSNVTIFGRENTIHNLDNPEMLAFLRAHPIDHPFHATFVSEFAARL